MGYTQINAQVVDQTILLNNTPLVVSGGVKEVQVTFTFCSLWDGLELSAVFFNDATGPRYSVPLDDSGSCVVPHEVLASAGALYFGALGESEDGTVRTSALVCYTVENGTPVGTAIVVDPSDTVYQQIIQETVETYLSNKGDFGGGGLTTTATALLLAILKDCYTGSDQDANIKALENELLNNSSGGGNTGGNGGESEDPDVPVVPDEPDEPVATLTSISATVNEDTVAVGTAASDLNITVTAHYSDGTTAVVTDYSISGTVAEGENTFVVVYGGKTTTVKVTGAHLPIYAVYDTTPTSLFNTGAAPFSADQDVSIFMDITPTSIGADKPIWQVVLNGVSYYQNYHRSGGKAQLIANKVSSAKVFGGAATAAGDNVKAVFTRKAGSTTYEVYWYQKKASGAEYWTKNTDFEVGEFLPVNQEIVLTTNQTFNSFEVYTNKYVTEAEALEFTGGTAFTEV